jgi:hypothetical protein
MAIAKSTRSERARTRSTVSGRSPARHSQPRVGHGSLSPPAALNAERFRQFSLIPRLRAIYGMAITAELALRQQAAEQDLEVAHCLRTGVCDPIADQIRALEEFAGHPSEPSDTKS